MKKRNTYKVITYFMKTKRHHEMSLEHGYTLKTGCSGNPGQGTKWFKAIATEREIETYYKELTHNRYDKPIRFQYSWVPIGKKGKTKRITTYIPNRHQRKHGIGPNGLVHYAQK